MVDEADKIDETAKQVGDEDPMCAAKVVDEVETRTVSHDRVAASFVDHRGCDRLAREVVVLDLPDEATFVAGVTHQNDVTATRRTAGKERMHAAKVVDEVGIRPVSLDPVAASFVDHRGCVRLAREVVVLASQGEATFVAGVARQNDVTATRRTVDEDPMHAAKVVDEVGIRPVSRDRVAASFVDHRGCDRLAREVVVLASQGEATFVAGVARQNDVTATRRIVDAGLACAAKVFRARGFVQAETLAAWRG